MKKIIVGSISLIMTVILLTGVNSTSNVKQNASDDIVQYTHGQPWG